MKKALLVAFALVFTIVLGCRGSEDRIYDDELGATNGGDDAGGKPSKADSDGAPAPAAQPSAPAKISGTVVGLVGAGLVLENNGGDDLTITAGGAFSFETPIAPNLPYSVTVASQPTAPTQTCTVAKGSGTAQGVDVIDITVTCVTMAYAIGGTAVGLAGKGLVLQDNGGNDLPVGANGVFTFTQPVPSGASFNVTVKTQPTGPAQTCSVSGATGTVVTAPVSSVVVNCGTNTYTVGGTVSGLAGTLVIRNNGADDRTITANGSFAFATPIANGSNYAVTVKTQPPYPPAAQTCTIANGAGTMGTANVTNVAITCTTSTFTVGGNVTGLTSSGLVLRNNGGNDKTIAASGGFTFSNPVASGSPYNVMIFTQPSNDKCVVTSGAGTVTNANITNVSISCSPRTVLSQNFDGVTAPTLPTGWSSTVVTGVGSESPWQTSTVTVNSAPNSALAGDYDHVTDIVLDTPPLMISSATAQLTFWNSFSTEPNWDGGVLEIAINGGAFQDILAAGGAFVQGGYNVTLSTGGGNAIEGRPAWNGAVTTTTIVNLPAAANGKTIVLRFRMGSDDGAGGDGWSIDDVVVKN
jgi:hypothetical protein